MTMMSCWRRAVSGLLCLLLLPAQTLWAADVAPDPAASPVWQKIAASEFAGRALHQATGGALQLEIASRAEDAATVPVAIRSDLPLSGPQQIEKIYLIVDNNPSPVAAIFSFHPLAGRVDLETRIRVDSYTHVRAVALLSDGRALMATRYVKAAGGCSAPAGRDAAGAQANLGKMRLSFPQMLQPGRPSLVQLMLSHPNESGLAMDQLTRLYAPAHFVSSLDVRFQGEPVLSAELNFSISENPHFRFYFVPGAQGLLEARVTDTQDRVFRSALDLEEQLLRRPSP